MVTATRRITKSSMGSPRTTTGRPRGRPAKAGGGGAPRANWQSYTECAQVFDACSTAHSMAIIDRLHGHSSGIDTNTLGNFVELPQFVLKTELQRLNDAGLVIYSRGSVAITEDGERVWEFANGLVSSPVA